MTSVAQERTSANEKLVKLRVVSEKFMETETRTGKTKVVSAPWANNKVKYNGKEYGPGDVFEAPMTLADQMLVSGGVQKASEKPKPYKPPSLEHKVILSNGIVFREDVLGKKPTRTEKADTDAEWEDDDEDDY